MNPKPKSPNPKLKPGSPKAAQAVEMTLCCFGLGGLRFRTPPTPTHAVASHDFRELRS